MIAAVVLFFALFFGAAWGAAENRLWREHGEGVILKHFKLYHLCMGLLFGWVNSLTAYIICGTTTQGFLLWVWLMLWDTLILDVVWWLIRYLDITNLGKTWTLFNYVIWKFPVNNEYDYGQGKPWHSKEDWDNYGKVDLWHGIYAWWYIFTALLIVLGVMIVAL